jgi:hypothetical protein
MSFESVAATLTGGSKTGGRCTQCAALKAQVRRQAAKIKRYEQIMAAAHAEAHKHEQLGKAGKLLPQPPIKYGKFEGWIDLAKKIKRIL